MHPSYHMLKPLKFCDAMEFHLEEPGDGTLFRLSSDILALITQELIDSGVDFRPLALLSPSFRQLARSVLFRVVTFDGRPECYNGILTFLHTEAFERLQNRRIRGQTQTPSLGACVRTVIVNPWNVQGAETFTRDQVRGFPEEGRTVARFEAYHDPLIHQVISSLPNLDYLRLYGVTISQSLMNSLVGSTVRRVELCARMSAICPRMIRVSWPITSLGLNLLADSEFDGSSSRSLYYESILRLCAPTLQNLAISHSSSTRTRRLSFNLSFPDLILLEIHRADLDQSALKSLLLTSKKLRHLMIDCTHESVKDVMNTPDEFHALRTLSLHWDNKVILTDITRKPLSFIANLGAVTSLSFTKPSPQDLSEQILEELHHSRFHRLEALSLVWNRECTPERLIEVLSKRDNASLQKLHLAIEEDKQSKSLFLRPGRMQVLEASCRGLKHLNLCSLGRAFHPSLDILTRRANEYGRRFPNLEYVRLFCALFVREDGRWAFLEGR